MIFNSKNSNKFSKSDLTDRPAGFFILVLNHQKKSKFFWNFETGSHYILHVYGLSYGVLKVLGS